MKTKMVLTFHSLLRAFCQKSSQVSWNTQNCGMSFSMLPTVGLWGHGRQPPCFSSGCLASDEYDPLVIQRQNPRFVVHYMCGLYGWFSMEQFHAASRRLPSPVQNSTYMFRDSCLKQAVQDRQIIITTCTWLEVLHSRAVQGRDLSKMLSNNVL